MNRNCLAFALILPTAFSWGQNADQQQLAAQLKSLAEHAIPPAERPPLRSMLGRRLREDIEAANRNSSAEWGKISSRADWEALSREKIDSLRKSLGELPPRPVLPRSLVTGRIAGQGFEIHNIVFESRPGLVVTANLYLPSPRRDAMPGLLLSHSHHNPKEQGELQDMGMTWARAGCYALVPDHLGHGERRQHPFITAADYSAPFQAGRQDYYFRYDTSLQLYLTGDTLMGWLVHDLMTGVDLLLAQPGIDRQRIAILGAVAGGGDPAAVTAALDQRIACAVPFNFGGPQPETRYPLPADAETSFNYAGGGSWESTRNLFSSAEGGFLPWLIAGSIAPRRLIHAHEFAWDAERDPVWKRYQRIWAFYDAADRLAFAHGHGTLTGQDPPGSHCNNIGAVHRRHIHEAFGRWLHIDGLPEREFSARRLPAELACLTAEARQLFQPQPLHELLARTTDQRLASSRRSRLAESSAERRARERALWARLLKNPNPPATVAVRPTAVTTRHGDLVVRQEVLETDAGIHVPLVAIGPPTSDSAEARRKVLLALADDGIQGLLTRRAAELSRRLASGWTVVLVEPRATGSSHEPSDDGMQGATTRHSATSFMLGQPLVGGQLRDLRAVWQHVKTQFPSPVRELTVLGDSSTKPLLPTEDFSHPHRIGSRPAESQTSAPMLALLFALFEDHVTAIETHGGLVSFRSVLDSPFVQIPHHTVIPGVLRETDIPDLLAALEPRPVQLNQTVDGRGRQQTPAR